jgi:uncharacterized membrane protein YdbT with pleckstrin-like domain
MESVGLSSKLLSADEHEVVHTRTHGKALIRPAAVLVILGAAVGAGSALVPTGAAPIGQFGVAMLGLGLAVWWVVIPFLRWRTTTYTITNRRLITRSGILTKTGTDLPLNRINEVASDRSLLDRMFGCGTLRVQTAADAGVIVMHDVPDVEQVHAELTEMLFGPEHNEQRDRGR